MERKLKIQLKTWSANKKYTKKSGPSITLDDLLVDIRKSEKRMGIPLPDNSDPVNLLEMCHPFLYFNYIVNWQKMPSQCIPAGYDTPLEFARSVIKDWQEFCWKKHMACVDEFNVYESIDRLRQYNQELLAEQGVDGLYLEAGYNVHIERLYQRRQEELDNEAAAYEAEQQRLQQERELALAEERARDATKKADELRRLQQAKANQEQAQRNREFSQQPNSPWTQSINNNNLSQSKQSETENLAEHPLPSTSLHSASDKSTPGSASDNNTPHSESLTLQSFERSLQTFFRNVYDYYSELSSDGKAEITSCGINYIVSQFWYQVEVRVSFKLENTKTDEAILGAAPNFTDALRKAMGQFEARQQTHQHIFEQRAEAKRRAEERRRKEEEERKRKEQKANMQSQLEQLLAQAAAIQKQMAQM